MTQNSISSIIELAETLNTRFAHDMAGPISAIGNGLEFMGDTDDAEMIKQAQDLLMMSAKESLAKLQTYRLAYGKADKSVISDIDEIKDILTRYFEYKKITFTWDDQATSALGGKVNSQTRRLLVNMVTMAEHFMAFGGEISIFAEKSPQGNNIIHVKTNAERIREDSEVTDILLGKITPAPTPYNVTALFMMEIFKAMNSELIFKTQQSGVELTAQCC